MDYGNTQKFDLDDYNLDADEFGPNPGPIAPNQATDRDPRNMGNTANAATYGPNGLPASPDVAPVLGQIVPNLPPGYEEPAPIEAEPAQPANPFTHLGHKAKTSDSFTAHDVKVVDAAIEELSQDGNIANFYDHVRSAAEGKVA